MQTNPLLRASALPYQLPPFDRVANEHFGEAFAEGMSAQLREVAAITGEAAPASFENTIIALERSGELLDRAAAVFFNLNASHTNETLQQFESQLAPQLAAHEDAIWLDPQLFARVNSLYERRAQLGLDPESTQLLERYYRQFVRGGARLGQPEKARLKAFNAQLSSLTTQFKQNVLKAMTDGAVVIDTEAQLAGLSPEQIGAAAQAATARGLEGKWLLSLQNTTVQPLLAQLADRDVRERLFRASVDRGRSGATDNTALVQQLVALRAQRAALLGYPSHAAYQLEDESAGDPAAVRRILEDLTPIGLARAREDARDLQALVDAHARAEGFEPFRLAAWDWPFYAQRLRKARFDFDRAEVAPYFELDRVLRDGAFHAAHELYGLTFKERPDLPVYHPDVRIFEVFDAEGAPLALFLADCYARDSKQGGAWMNNFVRQSQLLGTRPVVANNLNVPKPQAGQPTLLTFEEVTTLFHEFGHALHGMLSQVRFPLLQGTNVPRDFVEFPSQFNEMWARDPKVVANFARHYHTGQPMPEALLQKVLAAQSFDQGYATTEYLGAALVDQAWHVLGEHEVAQAAADPARFEAGVLERHGIDAALIPPRYHSGYFAHIFAGGYSAGYYAYIWSEVLARDAGQWFTDHGGLRRANGESLRSKVLARGRTRDPQTMFIDFYGRPPDVAPLVAYRGL